MGRQKGADYTDWTDAERAHVKKRWKAGATARVIGAEIGRSRNAVCGMISRDRANFCPRASGPNPVARRVEPMKPKRPSKWAPGEIDTVAQLWADGLQQQAIATAVGKSLSLVKHLIRSDREKFPMRYLADGVGRRMAGRTSKVFAQPAPAAIEAPRKRTDPMPHAPDSRPVGLEKRAAGQCAYPLWDSFGALPTAESPYCGAGIGKLETYCGFHQRLMYPRVAAGDAA